MILPNSSSPWWLSSQLYVLVGIILTETTTACTDFQNVGLNTLSELGSLLGL